MSHMRFKQTARLMNLNDEKLQLLKTTYLIL